ncbi:MAG: T9SS C-terminal target domain-containing protein, partial [Bacteroidetes bacterium]
FKAVDLLPDGRVAVNFELPNYPSTGDMAVFYKERATLPLSVTEKHNRLNKTTIWPNPATDKIYIKHSFKNKNLLITITDMSGRTILQTRKNNTILDISNLLPGVYIIEIESQSNKSQKFKLIKK